MNLKQAILTLLVAGEICAGTSAVLDRLNSPSTTHSNRPVLIQPVYAEEELTLKQITKEVQEKTVEEILGENVRYVNKRNLMDEIHNSEKIPFLFL